jgi:DNA repair exonuclease SbcCD nuclease subunit
VFSSKADEKRIKLQQSMKASFDNAIRFCIDTALDALVIVGDLFDTTTPSLEFRRVVVEGFKKLKKHGIKVYYLSGNHDYTSYDSKIRSIEFPNNVVTFFDGQVKVVEHVCGEAVYTIVGIGHDSVHVKENLIKTFPKGHDIGFAHSMVASPVTLGNEGQYLPSDIETINALGYKYFGLGHVHSYGQVDKDGKVFYSGTLQGMNRNELGEKGGLLVEVGERASTSFIPLASMTYHQYDFDTNMYQTVDGLVQKLEEGLKLEYPNLENASVTIVLKGRTKLYHKLKDEKVQFDMVGVLEDYTDVFQVKLINETRTHFDIEQLQKTDSVLAEALTMLEEMDLSRLDLDFLSNRENLNKGNLKEDIIDYFLEGINEN